MSTRVAVDAMGGDLAPAVVVEGAYHAARNSAGELEVLLFGPEELLYNELRIHDGADRLPIRVIDAPEVISMGESPAAAVKHKQRSSIHLGLAAHRNGDADVFVSAGNTGAVMAAAFFILGRIPNVGRPTIFSYFPGLDKPSMVLDVGSNVDCKPEHLVQFAQMGSIFAEKILKRKHPTVGLLNIGEEPGKGNEQVKAAYELLARASGLNFKGNIEGRDLFHHPTDVIVCDGFVGNIILKLGESVATALPLMIKREMQNQQLGPEQQAVVGGVLRGVLRPFDYEEHGGVPLLGVAGNVMIGHGGSSARAIERMIGAGREIAGHDVAGCIAAAMAG